MTNTKEAIGLLENFIARGRYQSRIGEAKDVLALLRKEQPPAGEFTKEMRRYYTNDPPKDKFEEALVRLDAETQRADKAEARSIDCPNRPASKIEVDMAKRLCNYQDAERQLEAKLKDLQSSRKELLDACKRMLGAMTCDELNNGRIFDDDLRKEVKEQAKAAIAKAKKEGKE